MVHIHNSGMRLEGKSTLENGKGMVWSSGSEDQTEHPCNRYSRYHKYFAASKDAYLPTAWTEIWSEAQEQKEKPLL